MNPLRRSAGARWLAAIALLFAVACSGEAPPVFFSGPILEGAGPEGQLALDGAVANEQAAAAAYVQVTFILYDNSGQVRETLSQLVEGADELGTLEVGEEGTFFVVSESPAEQIARIDYVLSYDDSSTDPATLR